jgi:predicted MPP superfamily phosphohydrolase
VALDYAKEAQPDLIVLGGDILEFYKISRYSKNPQRALDMQKEIDFVVENKLKRLRAACPKAQIDYHLGNHEARLFSYLCDNSPALSSLRCLQFDKLLSLADLEINLIGRESFVFQTKMDDNYKVYRGLWAWTHGTDCTTFPAHKEMQKHGVSGASGHVHRHTAFAKRDVVGFKSWMSVGASSTIKHGGEFIPSLINWETGFLLTFVHPKNVIQQHISTEGGFACVGGKFYSKV